MKIPKHINYHGKLYLFKRIQNLMDCPRSKKKLIWSTDRIFNVFFNAQNIYFSFKWL